MLSTAARSVDAKLDGRSSGSSGKARGARLSRRPPYRGDIRLQVKRVYGVSNLARARSA